MEGHHVFKARLELAAVLTLVQALDAALRLVQVEVFPTHEFEAKRALFLRPFTPTPAICFTRAQMPRQLLQHACPSAAFLLIGAVDLEFPELFLECFVLKAFVAARVAVQAIFVLSHEVI